MIIKNTNNLFLFLILILSNTSYADLRSILDSYEDKVPNHGIVAVTDSAGFIEEAAIGRQGKNKIKVNQLFGLGRISEIYIASIILNLQQEQKLNISDSIGTHLLIRNSKIDHTITINHLLRHASGLPNYLTQEIDDLLAGSKIYISPEILINQIGEKLFEKGERIQYSPSNYLILSLIIEKVTDTPFELYCYQFIQGLNLKRTQPYFNENFMDLAYPTKNGSYVTKNIASKQYNDVFRGYGTFQASAKELNIFIDKLFKDQIVFPPNYLNYMFTPVGVNQNAVAFDLKLIGKYSYYCNESRILGSQSYLYYDPRRKLKIILLCNDSENNYAIEILNKILLKYSI